MTAVEAKAWEQLNECYPHQECFDSQLKITADGNKSFSTRLSLKCDIWSLGVVLLEMLSLRDAHISK